MNIVAVDIGGTEIKGALFVNGEVAKTHKVKTNQENGRAYVLNTLYNLIDELKTTDTRSIGICTTGAVNTETGEIVNNAGTMQEWLGFSLSEAVKDRYNIPTFIENDANGAMIAEMEEYLNQGIRNAVMITLGTGVGSGAFVNGNIYHGGSYIVEFGHTILIPNGTKCTCGMNGCAEAYLSGSALTRQAQKQVDSNIVHGSELFDYYTKGNDNAIKVVNDFIDLLLTYLHNLNRTNDPEIFIIGGGVSNSKDVFIKLLHKKQEKTQVNKPIYPAKYGNFAGIKGAYLIALKGLEL